MRVLIVYAHHETMSFNEAMIAQVAGRDVLPVAAIIGEPDGPFT
jgi:putative NADPH-quinone reductase